MEYEVVNNTENQQFEIFYEGHKAELVYRLRDGNIYLMHTGVPKELEGKGIASALAEYALNYGKEQKLQTIVYCPFVKAYMKKKRESNN